MNTYVPSSDVWQLVSQFCNGEIESDTATHLSALLRQDAALKAWFVGYMNLHAQLQWEHRARRESSLTGLPAETSGDDTILAKAIADVSSMSASLSNPEVLLSVETAKVRGRVTDWVRLPKISPAMWVLVASTTAAFWVAVFAALSPRIRTEHDLIVTTSSSGDETDLSKSAIATLVDAQNCQWEASSPRVGDTFPRGSMTLKSGVAQVSFSTGVQATIEGPSRFELVGPAELDLQLGRIVASVPAAAIGFTIETPTARIVDLGTEFDVEVTKSGTTDVRVSKGKVELHPGRQTSAAPTPPITLSAGTARRIEVNSTGETKVREIASKPQKLIQPERLIESARLSVQGTMASSELRESDRLANHLINGNGLTGDRHTRLPNGTMWQSAYGKVKGEYVFFDLGRQCRLDSMKIWNYNEHDAANERYRYYGVGRASIYVSDTSKETPLAPEGDWRLVAADLKFSPADGSDHYASPNIFPLGGVTARFVAIVVDSQLAIDPTYTTPLSQSVGLSEVQFFGRRVTRETR